MLMMYLSLIDTQEEKDKFTEIHLYYRQRMYAVAYKILQNREDAEDVLQESFLIIIENLEKIHKINCHKTWNYIVTIVKSRAINLYHRKKRSSSVSYEEWNTVEQFFADSLSQKLQKKETAGELGRAIVQLPEQMREVLYLYYYNEFSYAQIAEILGITEENARQISRRANWNFRYIRKQLKVRNISFQNVMKMRSDR